MSEFVGREPLMDRLWGLLRTTHLLFFGPRRVGKSRLLEEMSAAPKQHMRLVRVDLQGATLEEHLFARLWKAMAEQRHQLLRTLDRVESAAGVELAPPPERSPWEKVQELLESLDSDRILVVALDEVPWWLDALERAKPGSARIALAELRRLRGESSLAHVRWVLTGSVGIASRAIRWQASAELNDLSVVELPPLDQAAGMALFETECLAHNCECEPEAAAFAHWLGGGRPHWIRTIAERARAASSADEEPSVITKTLVEGELARLLGTQSRHLFHDEGSDHFGREYGPLERALCESVLNVVCANTEGVPRAGALTAAMSHAPPDTNKATIEAVILRLIEDFYILEDEPDGRQIRVALPLFARWWTRWRTR